MNEQSPIVLLQNARAHIADVASLLRADKIEEAVSAVLYGLVMYIKHGNAMLTGGKKEYESLLAKSVYFLSLDAHIKEMSLTAIEYVPGREKDLLVKLRQLLQLLPKYRVHDDKRKNRDALLEKARELEKGKRMLAGKSYEGALKIFKRMSAKYNDDVQLHATIGKLLHDIGHIESITFFKTAVMLDATNHACFAMMGMALHKTKHYDQARDAFLAALEHDAANTTYLFNLARVYLDSRDWKNARETLLRVLDIDATMQPAREALDYISERNRDML